MKKHRELYHDDITWVPKSSYKKIAKRFEEREVGLRKIVRQLLIAVEALEAIAAHEECEENNRCGKHPTSSSHAHLALHAMRGLEK
jgi:hypothetical protein